jgi:hypothetical protein
VLRAIESRLDGIPSESRTHTPEAVLERLESDERAYRRAASCTRQCAVNV